MTSITKLPFLGKAEDGKEDKRDRDEDLPLGGQEGVSWKQLSGQADKMKP